MDRPQVPLPEHGATVATSARRYTIVSAVHDVEKYLDDYFRSITAQTCGLAGITLLLVDDGSSDGSPGIIRRWQARYPEHISYLQKENGGQASARNLGLQQVTTEWVTFVDPDDFLDERYFAEVDRAITEHPDLQMVSCNYILFREETGEIADRHPLRARFATGDSFFAASDPDQYIQLSVNSAFFRTSVIRDSALRFDEAIRPNFEDAHFVGSYLGCVPEGMVGFLQAPRYFYRKRADRSSTIDTGWQDPRYFGDGLRYGCLDLLKRYAREHGSVPANIQRTVLYHLSWQIKGVVDREDRTAVLDDAGRREFLALLREIFTYIDTGTILSFPGKLLEFFYKAGIMRLFKDMEPPYQIIYAEDVDAARNELTFRTFCEDVRFEIDGAPVDAECKNRVTHTLAGKPFVTECLLSVRYGPAGESLVVRREGRGSVKVRASGKLHKAPVMIAKLIEDTVCETARPGSGDDVSAARGVAPRVSVIVPVFNAEQYLGACLDSLLAQTLSDIEIVCVDDGSSDSSVDILRSYAARDNRVTVLSQANAGAAAARNRGLEMARGEYVLFVDADDFVAPTLLAEVIAVAAGSDADICIFGFDNYYSGSGQYVPANYYLRKDALPEARPFSFHDVPDQIFRVTTPSLWNKLFRREFLEAADARLDPDLRYAHDLPFIYGLMVRASRIAVVDKVLYHYRRDNPNSLIMHVRGLAPCDAISRLEADLRESGVFPDAERAFENLVMDQAQFTLEIAKTSEEFSQLHAEFAQRWVAGFPEREDGYYFGRSHHELAASIASGDVLATSMLLRRLASDARGVARERLVMEQGRSAKLVQELAAARRELRSLERIRNSRAYRIGRLVTALPRGIRRLMRAGTSSARNTS